MSVEPVTVGMDGSTPSIAASVWAADEAVRRGAPLHILHANPWRASNEQFSIGASAQEDWSLGRIHSARQEAASRHPQLTITGEATTEMSAKALLDAERTSQLLVLGSRIAGHLRGFVTGSIALPVVAHASGPVVLVRPGEDSEAPAAGDGPVLVGLDLHHRFAPVAEFAFAAAERMRRPLHTLHVWSRQQVYAYPSALPAPEVGSDLEAQARRDLDSGLAPWRKTYPGVEVKQSVVDRAVAPRLLQAAEEAGLVVVGRRMHKHLTLGTRVGPVTHAMLHHTAAPVAVVPHP